MRELKIPEIKDPVKAIRGVMLVTLVPFVLYGILTSEPQEEVSAKEIYEKAYNDSYSGRISEKAAEEGNRWHKFRLNNGRAVMVSHSAYDAAEIRDSVWKKAKHDTLYIKMPDGAVLGFDQLSDERRKYRDEIKKKR